MRDLDIAVYILRLHIMPMTRMYVHMHMQDRRTALFTRVRILTYGSQTRLRVA